MARMAYMIRMACMMRMAYMVKMSFNRLWKEGAQMAPTSKMDTLATYKVISHVNC